MGAGVAPIGASSPAQGQTEPLEQQSSEPYGSELLPVPRKCACRSAYGIHIILKTFVFDNDFPALQLETRLGRLDVKGRGILIAETEGGICRVVSFSPKHDLTLSRMPTAEIRTLIDVWVEELQNLGQRPGINYVQIFENRGLMMGCSNPHPHGQIWGTSTLPNEPRKEQEAFSDYKKQHGTCLLCDYLDLRRSLRGAFCLRQRSVSSGRSLLGGLAL